MARYKNPDAPSKPAKVSKIKQRTLSVPSKDYPEKDEQFVHPSLQKNEDGSFKDDDLLKLHDDLKSMVRQTSAYRRAVLEHNNRKVNYVTGEAHHACVHSDARVASLRALWLANKQAGHPLSQAVVLKRLGFAPSTGKAYLSSRKMRAAAQPTLEMINRYKLILDEEVALKKKAAYQNERDVEKQRRFKYEAASRAITASSKGWEDIQQILHSNLGIMVRTRDQANEVLRKCYRNGLLNYETTREYGAQIKLYWDAVDEASKASDPGVPANPDELPNLPVSKLTLPLTDEDKVIVENLVKEQREELAQKKQKAEQREAEKAARRAALTEVNNVATIEPNINQAKEA